MTPAKLSVKHPVLIASLVTLMLVLGFIALRKLPLDQYPDVSFPTVIVSSSYTGAGPLEMETLISKILEDQMSSISGVKKISSTNREGFSIVSVEFNLNVNLDFAENQVRAKVQNAVKLLPDDLDLPTVRRISPSDSAILEIALQSDIPAADLYDLAKETISPQFEQVYQVGQVNILGGRKREIHVLMDRNKLSSVNISASSVEASIAASGRNVPAGKIDKPSEEYSFRTLADYRTLDDIRNLTLRTGNIGYPIRVSTIATVENKLQDETSRTRVDGKSAILFQIYRQTGANTVAVVDNVKERMEALNKSLEQQGIKAKMTVVNDGSKKIRDNVYDVFESIIIGIVLTIIVVYFFLGSAKSTLITGFALPNSLLGACILMGASGFSLNIMSLLAMSLVVGLLVDDAIVVRENIFRKLEAGMGPKKAAIVGTDEVMLAVVATTLTILAVFGPIGNLQGIVGQFFKQFGLTVCYAMIISLFDGLFVAPAMSAYLGGGGHDHHSASKNVLARWNKAMLRKFDQFQSWLEKIYVKILRQALRVPITTIVIAIVSFFASVALLKFIPFTFMGTQDNGEFFISYELPAGASLEATDKIAWEMEGKLKSIKQIDYILTTVGSSSNESNKGSFYIRLISSKLRKENTSQLKERAKTLLKDYSNYKLIVTDQGSGQGGGGQRSLNLNIVGQDLDTLVPYAEKVLAYAVKHKALIQPDTSYRLGKPEYQIKIRQDVAGVAGVTLNGIGEELRASVEGQKIAYFREKGVDYDVRTRLIDSQRDLAANFDQTLVPNLQGRLLPLRNVAELQRVLGPTQVLRENRTRYIQITADIAQKGPGLGGVMDDFNRAFRNELKPPLGVTYTFTGEAERFQEMMVNMVVSLGLGMMFIYLVLASLYGSFITPVTIMAVIPLAVVGAFVALFVTRSSFDLFSMIGFVMLMGLATKNSILLIDFTLERMREGVSRAEALLQAGEARLRPIIMTSLALIAGMVPVAIGLNEASKSRTSLGIVVIGGTISSTVLTLVVIPAVFLFVDRFQSWVLSVYHRLFGEDKFVIE